MREIDAVVSFWFPETPDNKYDGIFTFTPEDGGRIKTLYTRFDYSETINIKPRAIGSATSNHEMVYGIIQGIGDATFINCKTYFGMDGYADRMNCQYIVLGTHLEASEPFIDNVTFNLTHLSDWFAGESTFSVTDFRPHDPTMPYKTEAKIETQKPIIFEFEQFKLEFFLGYSTKLSFTSVELQSSANATISLEEPILVEQFLVDYLMPFKLFIEFATDRPNYFSRVMSKLNSSKNSLRLELLFKENRSKNLLDKRDIQVKQDLLFMFSDIKNDFREIFSSWLSNRDRIRSVIDLYLISSQQQMFLTVSLQFLTQALEAFHREVYGGQYMTDEEYHVVFDKLISLLPETIPDSVSKQTASAFKRKLKTGTLKYANEYSQRKRFKDILGEVLEPISTYVDDTVGNKNNFIRDVVQLRNYFTHLGEDNKKDVEHIINDTRLFSQYIGKLSNILLACLLLEFEFSAEVVEEILTRNHIRRNWI